MTILPIERLTRRTEHFRCSELNATLSASVCVERQTARHQGGRNQHNRSPMEWAKFPFCAACKVGRQVAARVPAEALPGCKVCGVPVRNAGRRTPLCPEHRKAVP